MNPSPNIWQRYVVCLRIAISKHLNEALRDRLVCGLRSENIQRRLLAEKDLSLQKAVDIAQGMEAADRNAKALKGPNSAIHKVWVSASAPRHKAANSKPTETPRSHCYCCGKSNHDQKDCRFRDATCHYCKKKGHIAPACRAKRNNAGNRTPRSAARTRFVETDTPESNTASNECPLDTTFCISRLDEPRAHPFTTDIEVNGKPITMEIDTGASVSIISKQSQQQLFPAVTVEPSPLALQTYTGERLSVIGRMQVTVRHHDQEKQLALHVVSGNGPSLMGRDWLQHIQLDWKAIGSIHMQHQTPALQEILTKHAEIFKDELGTIEPFWVSLQVANDAKPRFCKARSVPFATKEEIEAELDLLEKSGILEKVDHRHWAAPIVAVVKKDGKIRICGDYKLTVNQCLDVDQYPLLKPDELFAILAGGQKFTKLDLSQPTSNSF